MFRSGLRLLFGTFTQLIVVIISYEFFLKYAASQGGIGAVNSIDAVHPLIWVIIACELIISLYLLILGVKDKGKMFSKL
ncbi:MAG TPA: hypothetical protein DIT16_04245 [Clostridium sp.]|nr:hypothetical protein [Clostridium sp.]